MPASHEPSASEGRGIDMNKFLAALFEALPESSSLRAHLSHEDLMTLAEISGAPASFLHIWLHGNTTIIDCESLPTGKLPRIQVSLSSGIYNLLQYWAASEQRNMAALAGTALEHGLRDLMAKGHVPEAVVEKYQNVSRVRLAAGELLAAVTKMNDTSAPGLDMSEES